MPRFLAIDESTKSQILSATASELTEQQKQFACLGDVAHTEQAALHVLQAVAGSGKTKSISRLIARVVLNDKIEDVKVMSSLRTSAAVAREAIDTSFRENGLDKYASIPNFCIRTIHSLALEQQRMANRPFNIVNTAKPFLSDVLDELALPARLAELGATTEQEAWAKIKSMFAAQDKRDIAKEHRKRIEQIEKKAESTAEMVSTYVRTTSLSDGEKHFRTLGFERPEERTGTHRGLSRAPNHPVHDEIVAEVNTIRTEVLNRGLDTSALTETVNAMLREVERRMDEANGSVDFVQLIRRFASSGEPVVRAGSVLIVDEAQDLTNAQMCVVQTTLLAGAVVFLVGDASQGICSFAGSSFNPIRDTVEWAEAQKLAVRCSGLTRNFRSTEAIIRASEAVLPEEDRALRGEVMGMPNDPEYANPYYANYNDEAEEGVAVSKKIVKLVRSGVAPGDIAVIRFKNWSWSHPLVRGIYKPADGGDPIRVTIAGTVSSGSLVSEKLVCAFRVAIGTEDMEDPFEQVKMLQYACRLLSQCNMPDELCTIIREVAEERQCAPEEAVFQHQCEIVDKARAVMPAGGKRNSNGDSIKVANYIKYLSVASTAFSNLRTVLGGMFANPSNAKLHLLTRRPANVERPKDGLATPLAGLHAVQHPLGEVVRHLLVHQGKPIDPTDLEDVNDILTRFDVDVEDGAEITGLIDTIITHHLDEIAGREAAQSVVFSTAHKFKGKQRARVFAVDMGCGFDSIQVDANKLRAHGALESKKGKELYQQVVNNSRKERKRLAHVMLSRPRYELHVSGYRGGQTMSAMDIAGFDVIDHQCRGY